MPRIEAAGETLSYLKAGGGAAGLGEPGVDEQVMLLIHGFASDARSWGLNQPALAANATVYAIDLPGHGLSPAQDFGGLDRQAAVVIAAILALSPKAPVHIVGHSMGGAIALRAASLRPDLVRALSLIAPAGLGGPPNLAFIEGLLAMTDQASARAVLQDLVANPAILSPQIVTGILAARNRPHTYAAWQAMAQVGAEIWARSADLHAALSALSMPTQIIWGGQDRVLPPPPPPAVALAGLHRMAGYGHVPHMEAFRQVNPLIADFGV
ncbi:alpha/beta fold hydrolase [Acidisoma cellulosilytica]|uniref:Alpha/beta fold hydrolase n=1 Tax=Acidisoma cellulosilyticum TaxID=2802395 RepID=A0A963Z3S3_9PROT|nr:alpha/beta fold hydrolase [Acidisoma cellulosilyticum]MCB8882355.1 alpha/beta fold hydrolase [Acidisoma cellulosilyticum]